MNRMSIVGLTLIFSGTFACAALLGAQQQAPPQRGLTRPQAVETSRDSRLVGFTAVRIINTAEARYKYAHGGYASWEKLSSSGAIGVAEKQFGGMNLRSGQQPVTGWALGLVVSASGKSYQLSLHNVPDECGFSFFSDEHGVIYQGGATACSIDLKPAS